MTAVERPTPETIFLARPGAPRRTERAAFLDEACGGDADAAGAGRATPAPPTTRAGSFLDVGSRHRAERTVDLPPAAEAPGTVIGPYKLLEQIGEGGMGTVWMAQQTEPVKRLVAVKLIKAGMDSQAGARPVRGGAAGAGADGPPQHRQGARRRHDRRRPAVLRHGPGQGRADHQVLRRAPPHAPAAAGAVRPGLPGGPARPPEGHHPPRPQAVQRPGRAVRRQAGAEGDRLRRRQGGRAAADRARRWSPASGPSSARWSTCRPSRPRSTSSTSTPAATSTRWACCCTSC